MNKKRDLLIWKNQILGHTEQAKTLKVDEAEEAEEEENYFEGIDFIFGNDES